MSVWKNAVLSRDKQDALLLIASSLLVLVPHTAHLPIWVSLACGATLAWRAFLTLRGRRLPRNVVLVPFAAAAMLGILHTFHTLLGRDAGVAMLVLLVAFKMLEMHARRDLFVVIFLCYFLVLTNFFYSQTIATAALMFVAIAALLTTQLSFQLTGAVPPLRARLWMGVRTLALATPLAAASFVLFPRIDGPLWGLPDDAHGAKSGLSDTMAPGEVSDLAQSDEVAFRVKFDGPPPAQNLLYWRGPVLGHFDGRTWTRVAPMSEPQPLALSVSGPAVRYQVTQEASNTRWLFALEMPRALPALPGHAVQVSGALEMRSADPLTQRVRYDVTSYARYTLQGAAGFAQGSWLQLPRAGNPRARAEGLRLRAEPDPARRVLAVLHRFATENFVYTLQPPLLPGPNAIDDFLFGTRAGFCEHYSGAFVFLMRAAGVPARVVTGYQGGELNPIDGYVSVRQSDAHAWAEVWLGERGWVRVDPTAAVAPDRVQHSVARTRPHAPFGLESLGRLMQPDPDSLLGRLRYALAAANNGWNQWVLNYNPQRQQEVVSRLQDGLRHWPVLAVIGLATALLLAARKMSLRERKHPVDALYSALCQRLAQLGVQRAPDEGPMAYAARVAGAGLSPDASAAAAEFLRRYSAWRYGPPTAGAALATTLKALLSRVR